MRKHLTTAMLACWLQTGALAQEWTPHFDLLTAGAASSVISYQICDGQEAGSRAAASASNRILYEAQQLGPAAATAYEYARSSYELKIKAMWQANSTLPCDQLRRLFDIAASVGFPSPRSR